jgi:branched-chain amino acid transport system substrate-binding protein
MNLARRLSPMLSALLLAAVTACGSGGSSQQGSTPPFLLAFISDLTDGAASQSQPLLYGFKTMLDWTNNHGGVGGHQIQLSVTDDAYDVAKGHVAITAAQSSGALAVVGGAEPVVWGPNAALAPQTQLAQFTLGMTENFAIPPQPYLYLMGTSSSNNGIGMINLLQLLIKNGAAPANPSVAIFRFASPGVQASSTTMQSKFKTLGWRFTGEQVYALTATDVSAGASALLADKPDVIFAPAIDAQAPLITKTLRQKGFSGPIVGFTGAAADTTFQAIADTGYYALRNFLLPGDPSSPGALDLEKRAKATGDTVGMLSAQFTQGYVMAKIVVSALEKCGDPCNSVKFNDAMNKVGKVDTQGLNPDIAISPDRHVAIGAQMSYKWDPNKKVAVPMGSWIPLNS